MTDGNEIDALKASMRGVRRSADALGDVAARTEALDSHADVPAEHLEELRRVTLAHAIAAQALRGLVQTMLKRRGLVEEGVGRSDGSDE